MQKAGKVCAKNAQGRDGCWAMQLLLSMAMLSRGSCREQSQPNISPVAAADVSVELDSVGPGCLAKASSMSRDRVKGVES